MWRAVYKHPTTGEELIVRTLNKPTTRHRAFRTAGGVRRFKIVQLGSTTKEVIIVAKTAKKAKASTAKKQNTRDLEDEDLEELEDLEDLDDLEDEEDEEDVEDVEEDEDDEEEDEDEEDEDEEDEEEDEDEPPAKSRKSKKSSAKSRAKEEGRVGTQEVASHFGVDSRSLRMVLRKHKIAKDADSGRYDWSSLNHPEVKKIGKLLKGGAAKEAKQEGLDRLKATKKAKGTAKKKRTRS